MAGDKGIRAGRAYVELYSDKSQLAKGLKAAQAELNKFGSAVQATGFRMMAAGGGILAPLAMATRAFMSIGDQLWTLHQRTGIAVETLSALSLVAKQNGTDITTVATALRKMNKNVEDLGSGGKASKELFDQLGISFKDLQKLSPEKRFALIANQISKISDTGKRSAFAQMFFGRGGEAILPMAANLEKAIATARKFGVVSEEEAKQADALSDKWDELKYVAGLLAVKVGSALAPSLIKIGDMISFGIQWTSKFIKEHKDLIVTVAKGAVILIAAGAALVAFGTGIKLLAFVIGNLLLPFKFLTGTFILLKGLFLALTAPGAIFIGVLAYLVWYSGAAGKMLGWLGERFADLKEDGKSAFSAIKDALIAEDIKLAAEIFWGFLNVEWLKGTADLRNIWINFSNDFLDIMSALKANTKDFWSDFIYGAKTGFNIINTKAGLAQSKGLTSPIAKAMLYPLKGSNLFDKTGWVEDAIAAVDEVARRDEQNIYDNFGVKFNADSAIHDKKIEDNKKEFEQEIEGIGILRDAEINAAKDKLKAAQEALAALKTKAGEERAAAEAPGIGKFNFKDWLDKLKFGGMGALGPSTEIAGTFGTAALGQMKYGSQIDRQINLLEAISKNSKDIKENTDDSGEFG